MAQQSGEQTELSEGAKKWLQEHLDTIRERIVGRAKELAKEEGSAQRPIEVRFVSDAAKEFAPGTRLPLAPLEREPAFWQRVTSGITGVTIISAILAIVFGALALLNVQSLPDTQKATLLDIAKLMAGAVVGSTGAAVAAATKRT